MSDSNFSTSSNSSIHIDGILTDWNLTDRLGLPGTYVPDVDLFARIEDGSLYIAIHSNLGTIEAGTIQPGTSFWLNTDQDNSTGYKIFGWAGGEEFRIDVGADGAPVLNQLFDWPNEAPVGGAVFNHAYSADMRTLELSITLDQIGNTAALNLLADINDFAFVPGNYGATNGYDVVDVATLTQPADVGARIAIVYSESTAFNTFGGTPPGAELPGVAAKLYSQLFMAAQNQAIAAGVPFDILTEADLTDLAKVTQYDTIVFPSFSHVNSTLVDGISSTLHSAVYDYGVGLITAGDFMTNSETGSALPGDPYIHMKELLGLYRTGGDGPMESVELIAGDTSNGIMEGITDGTVIHTYEDIFGPIGTSTYGRLAGVGGEVLAEQTYTLIPESGGNSTTGAAIQTTLTGGKNVHFATQGMLGDNNLLGRAIEWSLADANVPTLKLEMSRHSAVFASRNDMDQSQELSEVNPENGDPGIYDMMLPIIEKWKELYDFVGSYYINIGNDPAEFRGTDWAISAPYYQALLALGSEIGTHTYTHPDFTDNLDQAGRDFEFGASTEIIEQMLGIDVVGAAIPGNPESLATSLAILQGGYGFSYLTGGNSNIGAGYPGAFGQLLPGSNQVYLAPNISSDFTVTGFGPPNANGIPTPLSFTDGTSTSYSSATNFWLGEWQKAITYSDLPVVVFPWHDYALTGWAVDYDINGNPVTFGNEAMFTPLIEAAYTYGSEFVTLADLAARIAAFNAAEMRTSYDADTNSITAAVTGVLGTFQLELEGYSIASVDNWYAYDGDSVFLPMGNSNFTIHLGSTQVDVTRIISLPARGNLVSVSGDGTNLDFTLDGEGKVIVDPGAAFDPLTKDLVITGATATLRSDGMLELQLGAIGRHVVSIQVVQAVLPVILAVATDGGASVISGTATAGKTVTIFDDGAPIGTAVANESGLWSLSIAALADTAVHTLTASTPDAYGNAQFTAGLVLVGTTAADTLTGASNADLLLGGDAGDLLDGGAGADTMVGGAGDDTYVVDSVEDRTTEAADGGRDGVLAAVSWTLAENVEDLTLTGSDTLSGTGNDGDNRIIGNDAANVLSGEAGNDTLDGGAGADTLIGGAGDDIYIVDDAGDVVVELAEDGTDEIRASVSLTLSDNVERLILTGTDAINGTGNDLANWIEGNGAANTLAAAGGNDTLIAGGGNDTLDGGEGADSLIGGSGDDVYIVDDAGDVVVELPEDGTDEIRASVSLTLGDNVERLILTGTDAINGTGNGLANWIEGNEAANTLAGAGGNDTLLGGAGNDTLDGSEGADSLIGGSGDDLYIVDHVDDTILELPGDGMDEVRAYVSWTLGDNVERLTLVGPAAYSGTGNDLANWINGTVGANLLTGAAGNDTLNAGNGDDSLFGGADADSLVGGAGNDTLDGGSGADVMVGGYGDDYFIVDDAGDVVSDAVGMDTVQASINYTLAGGIETLILTGDATTGAGNALNNTIIGNVSKGGALSGAAGNDTLLGGAENDTLDGGAGDDSLQGGAGDDIYIVDSLGDTVVELADQGYDEVRSSIGWTLGANIERLVLTGASDISGAGNDLDNWIIGNTGGNLLQGGAGGDTLNGNAGNDELQGGEGADSLFGGTGNDTLDGGGGADTMVGGYGDDYFVVDNAGDVVNDAVGMDTVAASIDYTLVNGIETLILTGSATVGRGNGIGNLILGNASAGSMLAGYAGNDTLVGGTGADTLDGGPGIDVLIGGAGDDVYRVDSINDAVIELANEGTDEVSASVTWTLGANLERLLLTGTAAIGGTGNDLDNWMVGNGAANLMDGGAGQDTLNGGAGNDELRGGMGNDSLFGAAGNDTLDGGEGADTLNGGFGDDYYIVDHAGDVVIDGSGMDTVVASVNHTLAGALETLILTGDATEGTGNTLGNLILGNTTLSSLLAGGAGADTLVGSIGNDTLDGGTGDDWMIGGAGDDIFIVNATGDRIVEDAGGGIDEVRASVTFTLGDNLEHLVLTGVARIDGTGNDLDNRIAGNAGANLLAGGIGMDTLLGGGGNDTLEGGDGNDLLVGGSGADVLTGGAGQDRFHFGASNETVDRITDFTSGEDLIVISAAGFGGGLVADEVLTAAQFVTNTTGQAVGAGGQFVFETDVGRLWWDADGAGGAARIAIADLTGLAVLTAADIAVIA